MKTQKEKNEIIENLQGLKEHLGWKFLLEILEENIRDTEKQLLEEKIKDIKEVEILQRERRDRIGLKELPDNLIEQLSEKKDKKEEFDPYE